MIKVNFSSHPKGDHCNSQMITFKKHTREDIPLRVKWLNNPEVNRFIGGDPGKGTDVQEQTEWFEKYEKDENKRFFTICDEDLPIGFVGLSNISRQNRNADMFVAIGEDEYRGKGYGREAVKWILRVAFEELKLHKVTLGVFEENAAAVGLYKSLGFEVEGVIRDDAYFDGRFHDLLTMAIFERPLKQLKFAEPLPELVLAGSKTSTWRINDKRGIVAGDELSLCRSPDGTEFARAVVTSAEETTFGALTAEDKAGHEDFSSDEEMYATYSGYYKMAVGPETKLKIIRFKLHG